jgi:ABC-type nickel/cobalt efflux system permease component RcnA
MTMKKIFNRKILGGMLLIGLLFLFVSPVFAADTGIVPCGHDKACTLCDLITGMKKLFDYGIKIIAVITLACATFAGVMYVVSSGNESTMESAKNFLKASLIGLAVVLCAWVIVNTVITVLMPTKTATDAEKFLGTGKTSWYDFGSINCN